MTSKKHSKLRYIYDDNYRYLRNKLMIKQIKQQQGNVSDSCTECGSYVDIGAVVEADDTLLVLNFAGDDALMQAQAIQTTAQQRFCETKANIVDKDNVITLKLDFAFSVEKMIFQLENQL